MYFSKEKAQYSTPKKSFGIFNSSFRIEQRLVYKAILDLICMPLMCNNNNFYVTYYIDTESDSKISFANSGPQLSIDHQTLFFDNDTTVLAWKVLQPNRECQNNFKVEAKRDCADPSSVMKTWTLHGRNISIQSFDYNLVTASVDEMPVYFNITSRDTEGNACQEMISDIQFNNSSE